MLSFEQTDRTGSASRSVSGGLQVEPQGEDSVIVSPADPAVRVNLDAPMYVWMAKGNECEVDMRGGYAEALTIRGWNSSHRRLDIPLCHGHDKYCFYETVTLEAR
ncbi:hypothetical protein KHP62_21190 [Rhodobacteraceae bacterium NNCM2]|nr:hypothetical protein [Coraliihabitans acroporae]